MFNFFTIEKLTFFCHWIGHETRDVAPPKPWIDLQRLLSIAGERPLYGWIQVKKYTFMKMKCQKCSKSNLFCTPDQCEKCHPEQYPQEMIQVQIVGCLRRPYRHDYGSVVRMKHLLKIRFLRPNPYRNFQKLFSLEWFGDSFHSPIYDFIDPEEDVKDEEVEENQVKERVLQEVSVSPNDSKDSKIERKNEYFARMKVFTNPEELSSIGQPSYGIHLSECIELNTMMVQFTSFRMKLDQHFPLDVSRLVLSFLIYPQQISHCK